MSASPDRIEAFMLDGKVFLNIYEQGEIVAQSELSWEQAVEVATDLLAHAMGVRRRQGPHAHDRSER